MSRGFFLYPSGCWERVCLAPCITVLRWAEVETAVDLVSINRAYSGE